MDELREFSISKMQLGPGDILVLRAPVALSFTSAEHIRAYLRQSLPEGQRVLILEPGFELSVLTKADVEART